VTLLGLDPGQVILALGGLTLGVCIFTFVKNIWTNR
jgi:hypothetical protein